MASSASVRGTGCTRITEASTPRTPFGRPLSDTASDRIGGCLDYAVAESLFAHCTREALKEIPDNVEDPLRRLSSCFDDGHNPARPRSALGIPSPLQFERRIAGDQVRQMGRVCARLGHHIIVYKSRTLPGSRCDALRFPIVHTPDSNVSPHCFESCRANERCRSGRLRRPRSRPTSKA